MKALFMLTALFIANTYLIAQTAVAPALGNGSTTDPYQIASLENLYWIAAEDSIIPSPYQAIRWSSHYIQTADIDASSTIDWFDGLGWSPIGYYCESPNSDILTFRGSYNGQNHIIDALFINRQIWCVGFFGYVYQASIIQLVLRNVNISGNVRVGPIVGYQLASTVSDCYSTGNVSGNQHVGGLVGCQASSTISNSHSAVSVYGNISVGGLVGYQENMTIDHCFSTGSVDGNYYVGGLVGYQHDATIDKCYSRVNVLGNQYVGGLVGYQSNSTINNSYSTGVVSGNNIIGGLVGHQYLSFINSCYSASLVNAIHTAGGLVGDRYDSSSTSSYWDTEISGQATSYGGEGRSTQQMTYPFDADSYVGWDFVNIWAYDADHSINDGYPCLRQMPVSIEDNTVSGSSVSQLPRLGNYPNPFNPETTICFYLPQNSEKVDLRIFNLRGQLVRTLIKSNAYPRGESSIVWNGRDDQSRAVSSGLYFYHLITPQRCMTGRMTLMK
ncbi:MAG: GLUG motif-containing protein [Candidatus Cloacimonas sp.]|jgi:hypothetical protein|nr:GLUG motif-containing protein [Candidatus Cloacimonas sp.]